MNKSTYAQILNSASEEDNFIWVIRKTDDPVYGKFIRLQNTEDFEKLQEFLDNRRIDMCYASRCITIYPEDRGNLE